MKKITLFIALAITSVYVKAQTFSGTYTFDSVYSFTGTTDPTPVPAATGVTFGSFSAVGTPPNPNASGRFDFTGWATGSITGDTSYSQMTGNIVDTQYYEVTISPAISYTVEIDSISFSFQRSLTGVRTYSVRSSVDGFISNLNALYVAPNTTDITEAGNVFFLRTDIATAQLRNEINLSGSGFTNLSVPVTFRFYAWNAEGSAGTFSIDNVRIEGIATSTTTGIKSNTEQEQISVYPNPSANGIFTVDLGTAISKTIITVYDILGNVILNKEINNGNEPIIDLSNQSNGNYFIKIYNNTSITTRKITINR